MWTWESSNKRNVSIFVLAWSSSILVLQTRLLRLFVQHLDDSCIWPKHLCLLAVESSGQHALGSMRVKWEVNATCGVWTQSAQKKVAAFLPPCNHLNVSTHLDTNTAETARRADWLLYWPHLHFSLITTRLQATKGQSCSLGARRQWLSTGSTIMPITFIVQVIDFQLHSLER